MKIENVEISCILPVYNTGKYLSRTIEALQRQVFDSFEMIFVDDGSKDNSAEIILEYAKEDNRIKYHCLDEHGGAGKCRNYGMDVAKGKYLIFLDSDDFFYPELLSHSYELITGNDADLVVFSREIVQMAIGEKEEEYEWSVTIDKKQPEVVSFENKTYKTINNCAYIPWNKLVKRDMIEKNKIRFQELPTNNDIFFSFACAASASKIVFSDKILVRYFKGLSNSLTKARGKKNYVLEALEEGFRFVEQSDVLKDKKIEAYYHLIIAIKNLLLGDEYSIELREKALRQARENKNIIRVVENLAHRDKVPKAIQSFCILLLGDNNILEYSDEMYRGYFFREWIIRNHRKNRKVAVWGYGVRGKKWLSALEEFEDAEYPDFVIDENICLSTLEERPYKLVRYDSVANIVNAIFISVANEKEVGKIRERIKDKEIVVSADLWW